MTTGASQRRRRRHQALVEDTLNLAHALFTCALQQTSAAEACEGPGFAAILGGITAQVQFACLGRGWLKYGIVNARVL